ncbi:kinase-like domain-containing protein [Ephemerocybe angulata]|uniref:Kinase-like domain-containing protein n=1 Tax=Ephemerocybe angulata TaxID=980116 RepID=A0A8H6M3B8_9AGAR|nr:kinase-like domain-containing protein [Tulosesus angulatus]
MNLRNLDAPDAVTYLDDVKAYLLDDPASFSVFVQQLGCLLHGNSSQISFERAIVAIANILRDNPPLFNGVNALLRNGDRVECPSAGDANGQVGLFVLGSRPVAVGMPVSTDELLGVLERSLDVWRVLLRRRELGMEYFACLAQLLQVLLDDDSSLGSVQKATVYRCLRDLGDVYSILPPSMFLNHVRHQGKAELQMKQGGASSDIFMSVIKGTPICFRVLRMYDVPEEEREVLYKKFCKEVLVWRQLKHPNVLPFLGANTESFKPRFCFLSYWMNHGSITAYLRKHPGHDRLAAVHDIVSGIDYLHHLDPPVTHNDLKGANILVTDELACCLADFGLSSILESQRMGNKSMSWGGSVCWMAPELMTCEDERERIDRKAGDIFSLGCTIYEIYTGNPPHYQCHNLANVIFAVSFERKRPEVPPANPPPNSWRSAVNHGAGGWTEAELDLWWLVQQCWAHEPTQRPEIHLVKANVEGLRNMDRRARGIKVGKGEGSMRVHGGERRSPRPSKVVGAVEVDVSVVEAGQRARAREWVERERGILEEAQPSMGHRKRYTEEQRRPPFDETTESVCDRYPTPLPTTRLVGDKRYTQPSGSSSQLQRMKPEAEGGLTQWTRARPPSPHPRIIRHKTVISLGLPSPPLTPSNSDTSEPSPSNISSGNNCPLDLDVEWKRSSPKQSYMRPAEPRVAVFRRESRPLRPAHLRYAIVIESD